MTIILGDWRRKHEVCKLAYNRPKWLFLNSRYCYALRFQTHIKFTEFRFRLLVYLIWYNCPVSAKDIINLMWIDDSSGGPLDSVGRVHQEIYMLRKEIPNLGLDIETAGLGYLIVKD